MSGRLPRIFHADASVLGDDHYYETSAPISLPLPTIDVDTSEGYEPTLKRIVAFVTD